MDLDAEPYRATYRRLILASRLCGALAIALEAIADAIKWNRPKEISNHDITSRDNGQFEAR